jgi:hypothetical protein
MPGVDILPRFGKAARVEDTMLMDQIRQKPCLICHASPVEVHHLKTRGSFGSDVIWNLIPACRACHTLFHKKGISFMADKFIHFKEWLLKNGWEFNELLGRYTHE